MFLFCHPIFICFVFLCVFSCTKILTWKTTCPRTLNYYTTNISTFNTIISKFFHKITFSLKKGLFTIKNSDQRCFLWCHIRHLNPLKIHSEKITKEDTLDYEDIKFPVSKNDYSKIEVKNKIYIDVFWYENKLTYPVQISDKNFENSMELLLIFDETKSH